ncbi:MAG: hypothetical protein ABIF85_06000 [Nanoarchaeota archaeon]|nr:hypothetical protein [Nanoarchaeota archaeon]MCG2723200.1 hypothetical protein [archaeon]
MKYVTRDALTDHLKSMGFEELALPLEETNRQEFYKRFFSGVNIELILFKPDNLYTLRAYLNLNELFPEQSWNIEKNVKGTHESGTLCFRGTDEGQFDLDEFINSYEEKRNNLNSALQTVRKIPEF